MIAKYNFISLNNELHLAPTEIEKLIEVGLLLPEGWKETNHLKKMGIIKNDFQDCRWDREEVERYKIIRDLIRDKHVHFYKAVSHQINEISIEINNKLNGLNEKINSLRFDFISLRTRLDRQELMLDSKKFCEITGYKIQTFRNNMIKIDKENRVGRLNIKFYDRLIWHKMGNRWFTPLMDFEELRSGFHYELWLEEKKRKKEFQPKPKIDLNKREV